MPDIHAEQPHDLGLERASRLATIWSDNLGRKLAVDCTPVAGDGELRIDLTRSGFTGTLTVRPDRYIFDAKLGALLGAFRKQIESEVQTSLQALAQGRAPGRAPVPDDDPPA